jgi:hypothetical protein
MSVSIILRLVAAEAVEPDASSEPIVRGQAEVVETGETALFKDGAEMLAFVSRVVDVGARATGARDSSETHT